MPPANTLCAAPVAVAGAVVLVDDVVGAGAGMIAPVATATDVMGATVVGLTLFVVGLMTTVEFLLEPVPV